VLAAAIVLLIWIRGAFRTTVTVKVDRVGFQDIISTVSTNGKVEPVDDFQAHAPFATVVDKLYVDVGQKVSRGTPLLRLDDADARRNLASAEATLQSSQASLTNLQHGGTQEELLNEKSDISSAQMQVQDAQKSLNSILGLQATGAASANEVAAARQRLSEAEAKLSAQQARRSGRYGSTDIATAQAQVAQARQGVAAAQSALAGVDVRSPLEGTVYSVPVSQYDFVQMGEPLLNVADLDKIQVRAYFDEPEIGKLSVGQQVKIVWDAKPTRTWHGHIEQAPTTIISYGTRNVGECLITVDDAHGDLLPNTNVTVTVTTLQRFHVLSVPREALHTDGSVNFVYKVVDGHLRRTAVQVGVVNLTRVEITGGVSEGDTVALGATTEADLTDGLEVKEQP
jgi:HlyD family secretion protein